MKIQNKGRFVVGLSAGVIATVLIIACFFANRDAAPKLLSAAAQQSALATLTSHTGIVFPKGSMLYGFKHDEGLDEFFYIKIGTDQTGLRAFLSSNGFGDAVFMESLGGLFGPNDGWWDPRTAAGLRTAVINRDDGRGRYIAYAVRPNGKIDIYILWFTT